MSKHQLTFTHEFSVVVVMVVTHPVATSQTMTSQKGVTSTPAHKCIDSVAPRNRREIWYARPGSFFFFFFFFFSSLFFLVLCLWVCFVLFCVCGGEGEKRERESVRGQRLTNTRVYPFHYFLSCVFNIFILVTLLFFICFIYLFIYLFIYFAFFLTN